MTTGQSLAFYILGPLAAMCQLPRATQLCGLFSPWYNIGQGYHWEGLFESYIIGKLKISRTQIQLIAVSNFQRKCSAEHFSKMAAIR